MWSKKKDYFDPQKGTPKKASFLALTNPLDSYLHLGCSCFYANRIATWSYKYPPSLLVVMLGSCCVTKSYGLVCALLCEVVWEPVRARSRMCMLLGVLRIWFINVCELLLVVNIFYMGCARCVHPYLRLRRVLVPGGWVVTQLYLWTLRVVSH